MFKKQIGRIKDYVSANINDFRQLINERCITIGFRFDDIENKLRSLNDKRIAKLELEVETQQRTILALANALCNKYEHGLFVYSEDGLVPYVIRNGKEITDKLTQSFSISWDFGEEPQIDISQFAGTSEDDDSKTGYFDT